MVIRSDSSLTDRFKKKKVPENVRHIKKELSLDLFTLIITALVAFCIYVVASFFYPLLTGGAGYSYTSKKIVAQALKIVGLRRNQTFYDLGCGTGEALLEASRISDHVKGIEMEPIRWLIAKLRARKAKVIFGNFFKQDISDADVIFIFQYKGRINAKIAEKIKADTRVGTRIISYYWPIDNMKLVASAKDIFVYST